VVIHSSLSGNANEDHIRKVKADGYVAKFELNELSSVIEEVLDRSMKKIDGPLISSSCWVGPRPPLSPGDAAGGRFHLASGCG
jgi:hypothetical protein